MQEYWIIQPDFHNLMLYQLRNGQYVPSRLYTRGHMVHSAVNDGFSLDVEELFAVLDE